jgi:hypothetical protein
MFRPSSHAIRTLVKMTVMGHKYAWRQVGDNPPLLNLGQETTVQAMVADADQMGYRDVANFRGYPANAQTIHNFSFVEHVHFMNYVKLAEECRMEAIVDDTMSAAWPKQWLQKRDM